MRPRLPTLLVCGALLAVALARPARGEPPLNEDELGKVDGALLDRAAPMKVRLEAALILGRAGGPAAVPALTDALGDPEFVVRAAASLALGNVGDARAVEGLLGRLADPEKFVREEAVEALTHLVQRGYSRAVESQLRRWEPPTRAKVAAIAGALGPGTGDGLMAVAIADPDPGVRAAAGEALAGWSPPEAQRFLLAQLHAEAVPVRAAAIRLLGERHVTQAVPELLRILSAQDETSETIDAARAGLRALADQVDREQQLKLARYGSSAERTQAMAVLAAIRDPAAFELLMAALDDPDVGLRGAAGLDLGVLGDARAAKQLAILAGREENASIQKSLQTALRMLQP